MIYNMNGLEMLQLIFGCAEHNNRKSEIKNKLSWTFRNPKASAIDLDLAIKEKLESGKLWKIHDHGKKQKQESLNISF